jgi:hypothetical protein
LKREYDELGKRFPTMEEILELNENWSVYHWFATEFVRVVVGKKIWKSHGFRSNLSGFCSASGEAFCLLVVENNYERWCSMVESGDYADKNSTAPPPLYTNAGKSNRQNGKAKAFQGWTMQGYQRFDELYHLVKLDRVSPSRVDFENSLRSLIADTYAQKKHASPQEEEDDGELTYPAHDFEDVTAGGLDLLQLSKEDNVDHEDDDGAQSNSTDEEDHDVGQGEDSDEEDGDDF